MILIEVAFGVIGLVGAGIIYVMSAGILFRKRFMGNRTLLIIIAGISIVSTAMLVYPLLAYFWPSASDDRSKTDVEPAAASERTGPILANDAATLTPSLENTTVTDIPSGQVLTNEIETNQLTSSPPLRSNPTSDFIVASRAMRIDLSRGPLRALEGFWEYQRSCGYEEGRLVAFALSDDRTRIFSWEADQFYDRTGNPITFPTSLPISLGRDPKWGANWPTLNLIVRSTTAMSIATRVIEFRFESNRLIQRWLNGPGPNCVLYKVRDRNGSR